MSERAPKRKSDDNDDSEFYYSIALQDAWDPAQQHGYPSALCVRSVCGGSADVWLYGLSGVGDPDKTTRVHVSRTEVGEMIRLLKQLHRWMKSCDRGQA